MGKEKYFPPFCGFIDYVAVLSVFVDPSLLRAPITTVFNFTRPLGVFHQEKIVFRLHLSSGRSHNILNTSMNIEWLSNRHRTYYVDRYSIHSCISSKYVSGYCLLYSL